jgi:hypothetical protein
MSFRSTHLAAVASALVAFAAIGPAVQATAQAAGQPLKATLSGPAEKPPGDPHGAGSATFHLDSAKGQVCYDLQVSKIATATMAHIHKGASSEVGPPVIPLKSPDKAGKSSGCAPADAKLLTAIQQNPGAYYVNVHNAEFPGGAVRGQLSK